MFNPIGNALGQVLPALFVTKHGGVDDDMSYTVDGMLELMVIQSVIVTLSLALVFLFFLSGSFHIKYPRPRTLYSDVSFLLPEYY
jgi:hypothetical protein